MRDLPSEELIERLESLSLATKEDLLRAGRYARRLARDLPLFDSVWIDSLVQQRTLTPFQAAEIHQGRADRLRVGPYVLQEIVTHLGTGACYAARDVESDDEVWLLLAERPQQDTQETVSKIRATHEKLQGAGNHSLAPSKSVGTYGAKTADAIWIACPALQGTTAAQWMVPEGRFPPEAVLEIARQMVAELAMFESAGVVHGDLSTAGLVIAYDGSIRLPLPGVRSAVRPEEGFARTDLRVEAYDHLSPERVTSGSAPNTKSDLYACGLVWSHLLTGRPPLAGGDALTKLKTLLSGKIDDVTRIAPETPDSLAQVIRDCLNQAPEARPNSFKELTAVLGEPTAQGAALLARCLTSQAPLRSRLWSVASSARHSPSAPVAWAALAGCLLIATAATWPLWKSHLGVPLANLGGGNQTTSTLSASDSLVNRNPTNRGKIEKSSTRVNESKLSIESVAQGPNVLVLSPEEVNELDASKLSEGQIIKAPPGRRARVVAPPGGLNILYNDIHFENIDFVGSFFTQTKSESVGTSSDSTAPAAPRTSGAANPGIVLLSALRISFRGCSFQSEPTAGKQCSAIVWRRKGEDAPNRLSAPGRAVFEDCVFYDVESVVDSTMRGPIELQIKNTLHLGPGPLLRVFGCPKLDESIWVQLSQCTLRNSGPAIEIHEENFPEQIGSVTIETNDCVFAPRTGESLFQFKGASQPDRLLDVLAWNGEGSLLDEACQFALWRRTTGKQLAIDDATIPIEGLIRSRIEFAGRASDGPSASRIERWTAPLRGDHRPGISPSPLVLPHLE